MSLPKSGKCFCYDEENSLRGKTNQGHYPDLVSDTSSRYGISSPVPPQTSFRGETSGGVAKYRLFPQPRSQGSLWFRRKKRKDPGKEVALFFPIVGSDYYLRIVLTY